MSNYTILVIYFCKQFSLLQIQTTTLCFSIITWKLCTVANRGSYTSVCMFFTYLHTKYHKSSTNGSLVINIILKVTLPPYCFTFYSMVHLKWYLNYKSICLFDSINITRQIKCLLVFICYKELTQQFYSWCPQPSWRHTNTLCVLKFCYHSAYCYLVLYFMAFSQ
jgi:hypothetical protein